MAPAPAASVPSSCPPWIHTRCPVALRRQGLRPQAAPLKARQSLESPLFNAWRFSCLIQAPSQEFTTRTASSRVPFEAPCAHCSSCVSSPLASRSHLPGRHSAPGNMGAGAQLELRERVRTRAESEHSASSSGAGRSLLAEGISQLVAAFLRTQVHSVCQGPTAVPNAHRHTDTPTVSCRTAL